jgi:hypothetical protein
VRRSIQPSRASSVAGIIGAAVAIAFGIAWTAGASFLGAPPLFIAFGGLFVLIAIGMLIFNAYNASVGPRQRWGFYDVVDEEPATGPAGRFDKYCGKCGAGAGREARFCQRCGSPI